VQTLDPERRPVKEQGRPREAGKDPRSHGNGRRDYRVATAGAEKSAPTFS
jgi:hypothetical protein